MKLESYVNYEGQNSEIVGTFILKELGYEILHSRGLENRKMTTGLDYVKYNDKKIIDYYKKYVGNSFSVDILCKKGKQGYLFDIKMKLYKENKNLNTFSVTDNEVLNYDHLTKTKKIVVKIMINLKKDDGYYYGIFDWSDFKYPKNYDPNKTKKTTTFNRQF